MAASLEEEASKASTMTEENDAGILGPNMKRD
jgi:hypothetical protein